MQLYFAPMEGITGSVYRSAHHRVFGYVDKYYAPFIFTNASGKISKKDRMEIAPEYNEGCLVVPQLLSNCANDFIATARTLREMGFDEVNLNLGCPSGTVVSKGRGAGFLGLADELNEFLAAIFDGLDMRISIKTRIGLYDREEFGKLLKIYRQFPLAELIIHPRIRGEFYGGKPDLDIFGKAVTELSDLEIPVCYNGDLFTAEDFRRMQENFPEVRHWMFGRGLLANPALCRQIKGGAGVTKEELAEFYYVVQENYERRLNGSKKVVFLMKELWRYMSFILSEQDQKAIHELLHISDKATFDEMAARTLDHCTVVYGSGYGRQH